MVRMGLSELGLHRRDGPTPRATCQPMVVSHSEAAPSTMDSLSWTSRKIWKKQWTPSPWRGPTCGWRWKVFHCPQLTRIFRNSRPLCTIHSLMPLEMREVQPSCGRAPDSTPGTLPTPPCATTRFTPVDTTAPCRCTMRRRYSRFTARLTVAGDTPKDLATLRRLMPLAAISMTATSCSQDNRRGAPSFLPSAFAFSKPALVRRRMDTSSWSDTQAAKPARV